MKKRALIRRIAYFYPTKLRESYDRGGVMCGHLKEEINSILLCLDYDKEVYEIALKEKPDLIISHHPFLFGSKMKVLNADPIKKELYEKSEEAGLCIYSIHTNFDCGYPSMEGMNDALARAIGLVNIRPLQGCIMARGGDLIEPMEVHQFAVMVKEKLKAPYGLLIAEGKKIISNAAIIGGGGWKEASLAQKEGYDIFISGDIPHHERRDIISRGYNYLDLPHEIETIFVDQMEKVLHIIDPNLKIKKLAHEVPPEVI